MSMAIMIDKTRQLQKRSARWLQMVKNFLHWWATELVDMLPQSLRQRLHAEAKELYVDVRQNEVRLLVSYRGSISELGSFSLISTSGQPIDDQLGRVLRDHGKEYRRTIVRLGDEHTLHHQVRLPGVATENLEQVLSFEIDRYTPFSRNDVYFDFEIDGRNSNQKTVCVDLFCAPRTIIDPLLDQLQRYALVPQTVRPSPESIQGTSDSINLLASDEQRTRPDTRNRPLKLLAYLAVLLLALDFYLPLSNKSNEVTQLEARLGKISTKSESVLALRSLRDQIANDIHRVLQEKQSQPSALALLDELSRIIPDNTWLTRFELKGNTVEIQGESGKASELIRLLEHSRLLHNARFRSPVAENPRTRRERFTISATVQHKVQL